MPVFPNGFSMTKHALSQTSSLVLAPRGVGTCLRTVLCLAMLTCAGWAGDATVPMPVTGPLRVDGDTVTVPSGEISATGDLTIRHTVMAVLQPGFTVRAGGRLRIRYNSRPTLTSITALASGFEDTSYIIRHAAVLSASNAADAEAEPITFRVSAVSSGTLSVRAFGSIDPGAPVVAGTTMLDASNELVWTPPANQNGTLTACTLVAWDGGLPSASPVPLQVALTPVNDPPSFLAGTDRSAMDNAGAQSIAGWATAISAGPANESTQTLAFTCTGFDPSLFSVAPAVSSTGTLTFTPIPGMVGSTPVTITLTDSGGTANGGNNTSIQRSFTITIQDSLWATLPASTIYVVASETVYPDATNQDATKLTTAYAYQWHAGTNQLSRKDTTLPAVSVGRNGPGTATTIAETYDLRGRPVWTRDGDGFVHYRAYDAFSGAVSVAITDADTTRTGDFTSTPPFTTPAGAGLHLRTQIVSDALGRPTKVTDPAGSVVCTVYRDAQREVRTYPGWTGSATTGPTRVAREDWALNYREVLTMAAVPQVANGLPTGGEVIESVQSLVRERLDANGRVQYQDTYVQNSLAYATTATIGTQRTAANLGGAYETTTYTYTTRGFPERVTRADDTIEHAVTDFLGRVTARWKGTSATGWTGSADTATFKLIADYTYDGGNPGLGLLTQERTYGDQPTSGRSIYTTQHVYDGRGRLVRSWAPDQQMTVRTIDNLGRAIQTEVYGGASAADLAAATPPAGKLRARRGDDVDELGRVWRSRVFEVDPATGTVGGSLATLSWFDRRGSLIKRQTGASAFAKSTTDGAGRVIESWIGQDTAETGWDAARTAAGDTVAERTRSYPDAVGNVRATVRYLRRDDTALVGQLGAESDSHRSIQVSWYDAAHRPIGSADYGRDNGATRYVLTAAGALIGSNGVPSVAMPAPNSSDDYRVTAIAYDLAGRAARQTDNLGRISETLYDLAGRTVQVTANRPSGTGTVMVAPTDTDANQKTVYEPAVGGGVAVQRVTVANGSALTEQVTRYLRADPIDRALVTTIIYPDSAETAAGGVDQVAQTYDRLGRLRTRTDQRRVATDTSGVVREFAYDAAGRLFSERVANAILPTGIDGAIRRIQYGYDDRGRPASIASYDQAGGTYTIDGNGHVTGVTTPGTMRNEVRRTWNGWGNLTATAQAHEGAVGVGTPTVGYGWDAGVVSGVARSLRQTGVTYPSSGLGVTFGYPTSGLGAALDRPDTISAIGGTTVATAQYLGVGTLARLVHARAGNATLERSTGGAADGYDRFWSVSSHAWTVGASAIDGGRLRRDRIGRIVTRWADWATARADRDEVSLYDQLDRLASQQRGQANASGALANPVQRSWAWTLDHAGNWRSFASDADGAGTGSANLLQARSHNLANEIDSDNDHANAAGDSLASSSTPTSLNWIDPIYDAAGAMTTLPKPGSEATVGQTAVWDGWGRLVAVREGATTVWSASYDGTHRLIRTVAGGVTRDLYLDEEGREVEVRTGGGAGTLSEVYIWARSGDRLLRMGTGAGAISTWYAVLTDQQGTVTALVQDGSSTVLERYRYDAYGVRTMYAADGSTVRATSSHGMRYAFQGRPFETATGLGYFRARWYHASLGRFISRDPAGYIDGASLYQFVRGNPLWFVDPMGLAAKDQSDSWISRLWPTPPAPRPNWKVWDEKYNEKLRSMDPSQAAYQMYNQYGSPDGRWTNGQQAPPIDQSAIPMVISGYRLDPYGLNQVAPVPFPQSDPIPPSFPKTNIAGEKQPIYSYRGAADAEFGLDFGPTRDGMPDALLAAQAHADRMKLAGAPGNGKITAYVEGMNVVIGVSRSMGGVKYADHVTLVQNAWSTAPNFDGGCAEPNAVSNGVNMGMKGTGGTSATVFYIGSRHGQVAAPCTTCLPMQQNLRITIVPASPTSR